MSADIWRKKAPKQGLDLNKACPESMAFLRITKATRDSGRYSCAQCGRAFVLGVGERASTSAWRKVPKHLAKKVTRSGLVQP